MAYPVYTVYSGDVLPIFFDSFDGGTGASITMTGLAVTDIEIYKDGSTTQRASDAGYTLLDTDGIDFDGITGIHGFSIDTGDNTDAGFYAVGSWFHVVVSSVTIDAQTVNFVAAAFRIVAAEAVAGVPVVDVKAISGDSTAADNLETACDGGTYNVGGGAVTLAAAYDAAKSAASQASVNTIDDFLDTEVAAILADTNELQTDLTNGGRLDLLVDAIKAKTDNLPADPADASDIAAAVTAIDDYVDTEVAAILADTDEIQQELADGGRLDLLVDAIKAKTDNLPADPADDSDIDTQLAAIAGYLDTEVAAILADTAELQAEFVDGGRLDLLIDAIKAKTDNLPADPADQSAVEAAITAAHSTTDGKIDAVDDYVDAEIAAILADTNELQTDLANGGRLDLLIDGIKAKTDNLPADPADASDIAAAVTAIDDYVDTEVAAIKAVTDKLDTAMELDVAVYRFTTNALEQSPAAPTAVAIRTEMDANSTQLAAIVADTNELQTDLVNGGRLDLLVDAIKAKTDNLPADPADDSDIDTQLAAIAGYLDTEVAAILADTNELQGDWVNGGRLDLLIDAIKAKTDNLPADPADASDIAAALTAIDDYVDTEVAAIKAVTDKLDTALELDVDVYRFTTNALEQSPAGAIPTVEQIRAEIDTNSTQLAAIVADTNELQTDLTNGGRLDLLVDAIKAKTDNLPADPADASDVAAAVTAIDDYVDTEVAAILADTNELQADWANGGRLDLLVDAIKAKTDNLPADPADDSDIDTQLAAIAGYLDTEVAAILADTNELQTDLTNGGRLDLLIDAIKAKTDNLPADPADASDIAAAVTAIDDYVDTEVAAILADTAELQGDLTNGGRLDLLIDAIKAKTDGLPADPADASDIAAAVTAIDDYVDTEVAAIKAVTDKLDTAMELDGAVYRFTTNALEQSPAGAIPTVEQIRAEIDTNSTQLAAIVADTNELQTDLTNGGRLDLLIDAIKAKTDNLPADPADASDVAAAVTAIDDYVDTEVAAILADTNEIQTDLVNGGRLDLLVDAIKAKTDLIPAALDANITAIKAKTDNLPVDPADQSAVEAAITAAHATTNGKVDAVDDYVDTEVAAIKAITDKLDTAMELDGAVYRFTTNALEQGPVATPPTVVAIRQEMDANSTQLAAIVADTNELQTDLTNGGRLDLLVDAIKAKTDNLPADPADQSSVEAAITAAHATTDGKVDAVDDYVDTEVAAIKAVTDKLDNTLELDGAVYRFTANALETGPAAAITALAIRQEMDANSTQLAAIVADTNELQTDLTDGGRLDLLVDAIKAKTDNLPADPADDSDIDSQLAAIAGYLDTEVAAILADTAELQGDLTNGGRLDLLIDAIKAKTDNLPASPAATGAKMDLVDAPNATALNAISDDILDRDLAAGVDANTRSLRNAVRAIRNKVTKADTGVITVTKEDDATPAWTLVQKTTVDNDPV